MDSKSNNTPLNHRIISAAAGSLAATVVVTPLDVIKTRMQAFSAPCLKKLFSGNSFPITCKLCHFNRFAKTSFSTHAGFCLRNKLERTNTLSTAIKIIQNEGASALWRGASASILFNVPSTVLYLNLYEAAYSHLKAPNNDNFSFKSQNKHLSDTTPVLAGVFARTLATMAASPFEFMRTQMQSAPNASENLFYKLSESIQKEGIFGLWRGLWPTLVRDVPFSAGYWYLYENAKARVQRKIPFLREGVASFLAGAGSGIIMAFVLTPVDVVKTRVQLEKQTDFNKSAHRKGVYRNAAEIVKKEGFFALFRGATARLMKIPLACGVLISTYEVGKKQLSRQQNF